MKIKLSRFEALSIEETFFVIGGQVNPERKNKREERRAERKRKKAEARVRRKTGSDSTDTVKNDRFKSKL